MSFLPKRVKDLPPLEPDSEDEFKTPQKDGKENQEIFRLPRGDAFEVRRIPKRVSELPPLESDSDDDEAKNDKLNCAILNDSFIISPAKSDLDDISPSKISKSMKVAQSAGDDSLLICFNKMQLNGNVSTVVKETKKSPLKSVEINQMKETNQPQKPLEEQNKETNNVQAPITAQPLAMDLETPLKVTEAQFATPQIRTWSVARRPKEICSTRSQKNRTAIANEFRSQKVLFQTPMAVSRAPISCLVNDSITLSLCDTINESGTPNLTDQATESKPPSRSSADINSKKSLIGAFGEQNVEQSQRSKKNIIVINGSEYVIQEKLGCGGSSSVYLATQKESGKECALKIVDLQGDAAVVEGYLNETKLLAKLQGNISVVTLYEYELLPKESKLFMVMEKGDSDLHKILQTYKTNLPLYQLMHFWYQMLQSVNYIHQNGVIHSDLKPANFLMIHGRLKLIDFGIASNIAIDSTSIIKFSQAGTFNYISPEALTDTSTGNSPMGKYHPKIKISTKSDVWSLGCILYLLLYQKTPFGHIKNINAKVNAISSPSTEIQYPAIPPYYPIMLVQMAQRCLQHNPKHRPSVAELLQYPFHMVIPIQNLSVATK